MRARMEGQPADERSCAPTTRHRHGFAIQLASKSAAEPQPQHLLSVNPLGRCFDAALTVPERCIRSLGTRRHKAPSQHWRYQRRHKKGPSMTTALLAQPDSAVLDEFIGRMIGDLGATVSAGLVVLGDRLGLYKAMADGEPLTAEQLASRTGT